MFPDTGTGMNEEKKIQAVNFLCWQRNYLLRESGVSHKAILKEFDEQDEDFEKAFDILNLEQSSVLELGCGLGDMARQIATRGHSVKGIDISALAIANARENTAMPNCTYDVRDFFADPVSEQYDVVVDRGFLAILRKTYFDTYFTIVRNTLAVKGYFLLKIDSEKIKKHAMLTELIDANFTVIKQWDCSYLRSDDREIKTIFYICQKNGAGE
jgi:cyclopropane fatty-acyl-phospholipid synthase-like methyltransferase